MTLTLDRRNPAQFSKWAASFRVQKQRQVCVRYELRNGQQVCAQTGYESYEAVESKSGSLQVRRASKPETYYETQQQTGAVQVKRIP